jgi:hypothetical protein
VEQLEVRLSLEFVLSETNYHFSGPVSPSAVLLVVLLSLRLALSTTFGLRRWGAEDELILVLLVTVVVVRSRCGGEEEGEVARRRV